MEEILSYFEVKPPDDTKGRQIMYKKGNLYWVYNLPNKTKDGKLISIEVVENYLSPDLSLRACLVIAVGPYISVIS